MSATASNLAGSPTPPGVSMAQMRTLLQVSRALTITVELDPLLHRIAEATAALLGCERASIFLHDPRTHELWSKVALQSEEIRIPAGDGIAGHAFRHNAVIHVPDAYADARFIAEFDRRSGFRTRNLLAVPMVDWDERPVGVVQALNKTAGEFCESDASLLRLLADQAGVALQRWRLQQAAIQSTSLRHEMELARRVQQAVIPEDPPRIPGLRAAGWMQTASINGGDCYDLWPLPSGELGVFVGDASGHGMQAALVISQARTLIRMLSETELDPTTILHRVNHRLVQDVGHGKFVTTFLAFISPTGEVRWCSAGQGPIIVCAAEGNRVLDANLPPLGILAALPSATPSSIQLHPGDFLLLPSDGVVEAFNQHGELMGSDRVVKLLLKMNHATPEAIIATIRDAVIAWQARPDPADDQTLVVIQRTSAD